jgi:hypothetical protein
MRRAALFVLVSVSALSAAAAPEGRWAGYARLPGRELPVVVDLAPDPSGVLAGSLTIPGFDVKGAALGNVKVEGSVASFEAANVLSPPAGGGGVAFKGRIDGDAMVGEMRQGGNTAPFRLERTGPAQVDPAARSTPVANTTQGRWVGQFELGGYPRHVTLDIANEGSAAPRVDFVVVGKQTSKLPIDLVSEEEGILRIESRPYGITLEARVASDRIEGTLEVGPTEIPILLRRPAEKTS